jgi:hypothetical protein
MDPLTTFDSVYTPHTYNSVWSLQEFHRGEEKATAVEPYIAHRVAAAADFVERRSAAIGTRLRPEKGAG